MNSPYSLSQDELDRILNYINGDDDTFLDTNIADKLNRIAYDLNKKLRKDILSARAAKARVDLRLETYEAKKKAELEAMAEKGSFETAGLDSVDVGKAIVHCLRKRHIDVTKEKVNALLYQCYASFLASGFRKILTVETPVAQKWGPQFWRMANAFKDVVYNADAGWKTICEASPAIAKFIENIVGKYGYYNVRDLIKEFINSAPYKNALVTNDGKKNGPIAASDIYRWKKNQL